MLPDASSTHLAPGSEHPWPGRSSVALLEGELALIAVQREPGGTVLNRRTLACLVAPCRLPDPPPLPPGVELRVKVVRPARIQPLEEGVPAASSETLPPALLPELAEQLSAFAGDEPFSASGQGASSGAAAPPVPTASTAPLLALASRLAARHGRSARPLLDPPADPLDHLRALLEQAGLIALPLQIGTADLRCDCGDLVLLRESGPLLLLSESDGYSVWDPSTPARARRRLRRRDLPRPGGPWPALGVSPTLPEGDASPAALLRFSVGPAHQQAAVLIE